MKTPVGKLPMGVFWKESLRIWFVGVVQQSFASSIRVFLQKVSSKPPSKWDGLLKTCCEHLWAYMISTTKNNQRKKPRKTTKLSTNQWGCKFQWKIAGRFGERRSFQSWKAIVRPLVRWCKRPGWVGEKPNLWDPHLKKLLERWVI